MDEPRSPTGWRALGLVAVLVASLAVSYEVTRVGRRLFAPRPGSSSAAARSDGLRPPSGKYLIAYVLVSNQCAACRDVRTKAAIRSLRDSLRSSHSAVFAKISVVGVDIDDIQSGVKYLLTYGPAFDELSVGGAWTNEIVTRVVWHDAMARAEVPAVVLFQRQVDARMYPRDIRIGDDSELVAVAGRDSLVQWISAGTPLTYRGWANAVRQ